MHAFLAKHSMLLVILGVCIVGGVLLARSNSTEEAFANFERPSEPIPSDIREAVIARAHFECPTCEVQFTGAVSDMIGLHTPHVWCVNATIVDGTSSRPITAEMQPAEYTERGGSPILLRQWLVDGQADTCVKRPRISLSFPR
jgi:hypothetical protein